MKKERTEPYSMWHRPDSIGRTASEEITEIRYEPYSKWHRVNSISKHDKT